MQTAACTRQLALVDMSAAIAGGAAVVPANAADARMSPVSTTASSATRSPTSRSCWTRLTGADIAGTPMDQFDWRPQRIKDIERMQEGMHEGGMHQHPGP